MIIKSICLENFGKFHNKELEFSDGINLLYGENEAGKTTLHTFIKGMLFGLDGRQGKSSENNEYEKYIPWEEPDEYKGSMKIELGGIEYFIERNFLRSERSYKITRQDTGEELSKEEIEKLFYGFDENCYYNTISISQLGSITNQELEKVLKNYTSNLGSSKTTEIDVEEALNNLEDIRERLMEEGGADRREEVEREIRTLKRQIEEVDAESRNVTELVERNRDAITKLKTKTRALEVLDNVQTERKIKKNIDQENLIQRYQLLSSDIERLTEDKKKADKHKDELKYRLDLHSITSKSEVEKQMEMLLAKSNISIVCIIVIVAALGLLAGFFFSNPGIVFSEFTTWIKEATCLLTALISAVVLAVLFFRRKKHKEQQVILLKDLKIAVDRYEAAKGESEYAEKQLRGIQRELDNIALKIQEEEEKVEDTSDYNSEIDDLNIQISELREEMSKAQWTLEQKKESLFKLRQQLDKYELRLQKIIELEVEIAAVEEAIATIHDISDEVRRSFGKKLNEKASVYMSNITNGKYNNLIIDEEMNMTVENRTGRMVPIEKLSKGTVEQMYMSLRLAASDIIFEDDTKPILLDDAFVMYDNKRMANTLAFMADSLEQVIVFSCHTREKVMADRMGLEYNLIVMD